MTRRFLIALLALIHWLPATAQAGDTDWRQQVVKMQAIERLMAASIKVRDRNEMRNQVSSSEEIIAWLKAYPARREIPSCGMAMFALSIFGGFMFGEDTADRYLERSKYLGQYKAMMPECEKRLGLPPAAEPNLRNLAI